LAAGVIGLAVRPNNLFLFNDGSTVTGAIILEVTGFKMPESTGFGQLDVLNFSRITADGFVKIDDLRVGNWKGSKKLKDVFRVILQLAGTVRHRGLQRMWHSR
jgi:hypothetical protein